MARAGTAGPVAPDEPRKNRRPTNANSTRPPATIRFVKFNRENPVIYTELVKLARQARRRRTGQLSIKFVFEGLRWTRYIATTGVPYRVSNSFTAYYARLIMGTCEDLADVFVLRPSVADEPARLVDVRQGRLWEEARRDDGWLEEAADDLGVSVL